MLPIESGEYEGQSILTSAGEHCVLSVEYKHGRPCIFLIWKNRAWDCISGIVTLRRKKFGSILNIDLWLPIQSQRYPVDDSIRDFRRKYVTEWIHAEGLDANGWNLLSIGIKTV